VVDLKKRSFGGGGGGSRGGGVDMAAAAEAVGGGGWIRRRWWWKPRPCGFNRRSDLLIANAINNFKVRQCRTFLLHYK